MNISSMVLIGLTFLVICIVLCYSMMLNLEQLREIVRSLLGGGRAEQVRRRPEQRTRRIVGVVVNYSPSWNPAEDEEDMRDEVKRRAWEQRIRGGAE